MVVETLGFMLQVCPQSTRDLREADLPRPGFSYLENGTVGVDGPFQRWGSPTVLRPTDLKLQRTRAGSLSQCNKRFIDGRLKS